MDWFPAFHRRSRMLIAAIVPVTLTLQYANEYFGQLLGIDTTCPSAPYSPAGNMETVLRQLLSEADFLAVQRLYRRHMVLLVLRQFYHLDASHCRLREAPAMVALSSPVDDEPRYIEFWFQSDQLSIARIDPTLDEFADLGLASMSLVELEARLTDPVQLREFEQQICMTNYQIEGLLLLEGLDVTVRETIRRITQLLIDQNSVLHPQKFQQVNQQLRSLFRHQNTIVLTLEKDQIRVFIESGKEVDASTHAMQALQDADFLRTIQANQITIVADLTQAAFSPLRQQLIDQETRSLLLIPLSSQFPGPTTDSSQADNSVPQVIGLVGLLSDRPNQFDGLDVCYAEQLIPAFTRALTSAQRQLVQQRFITNIHPAVEWRFLQELERRSLGLTAEPIVFTNVYPLYGISDIRGSSEARNQAIQLDLVEQLQLALAVVEAVWREQQSALVEQLRLDLVERIERLQTKITVEAEVAEIRYLHHQVECYFDYFAQGGAAAIAAIAAYQSACNNSNQCVYRARAEYDQEVQQISAQLQQTWERWQVCMQQITPHYCDIETTDGIDHMIYAGAAIDPKFGKFQLRSLRYEQLRALCDCARIALSLLAEQRIVMQMTHLILVQDATIDIFHNETTEKLFDVRGTRDTRYEIVKKRIDKAIDEQTHTRITQPGMVTLVYSTQEELEEYQQYLRYLRREGWVGEAVTQGMVEPLQGVTGLKYIRVQVLPESPQAT